MKKANKHIGSDFDGFLEEQGLLEESSAIAMKRVIAWQIAEAMKAKHMTKSSLAAKMKTSRAQLDRLLDATDTALTLATLSKAANALGRRVRVELAA